MGYLDTLKSISYKNKQRLTNDNNVSKTDIGNNDRTELLRIAKQNIDPLDIKTDFLPDDYKPKVPKHIIQRNLERQAKLMNQKKKNSSNIKYDGQSGMKKDESEIVSMRLLEKFELKRKKQGKPFAKVLDNSSNNKEPEKKLSFKEIMKLAEVNKNKPKIIETVKQAPNKVKKQNTELAAASRAKLTKANKKSTNHLIRNNFTKNKEIPSDEDKNENYISSGFDMLMDEEMQSEAIARKEDLKEAKNLKKKELEKKKLKLSRR
ncbi:hypothetical protein QEN19_001768 [Hanseniaspora menglaensis]